MAGSNTCAAADSSLPRDYLEAIRVQLRAQQANGGKTRWEVRTGKTRTHFDAHDCCLLEDAGGDHCDGECCLAVALKQPGTGPGKKVPYDDDSTDPKGKPHKPIDKPAGQWP